MQFSLCFGACCQVTVLSDLFSLELVTPSLHRCSLYICTSFVAPQPFLHTVFTRFSPSATAKSPQSCPTLCDPTDGSPPGSPVPGILQARTPEWVAISFSSAWKWKVKAKSLSHVRLFATPWTAAHQALRPWDFPGKSTGVGCHRLLQIQMETPSNKCLSVWQKENAINWCAVSRRIHMICEAMLVNQSVVSGPARLASPGSLSEIVSGPPQVWEALL